MADLLRFPSPPPRLREVRVGEVRMLAPVDGYWCTPRLSHADWTALWRATTGRARG